MARILVTGASGLLGRSLGAVIAGSGHEVVGTAFSSPETPSLKRLDVRDSGAVTGLVADLRPDVVIHAAANCNVDDCERNAEAATLVNVGGTGNVAEACRSAGSRLVYISTDHVFPGVAGRTYVEESPPEPLQHYGRTKLAGEALAATVPGHVILRLPVLYGHNGRANYFSTVLARLQRGETLRADDRQVRYPVLIDDVAGILAALIADPDVTGVLHAGSDDGVTKYEWALLIARAFGFDSGRIAAGEDPPFAPRPPDNRLASNRWPSGIPVPRSVGPGVSFLAQALGATGR